MLLQFNFKNFKSFRDDVTLDLTATRETEFNNHVISTGTERVLPIAAIYGANASGKSNVQEAFRYMHTYISESLAYGGDESVKKRDKKFHRPTPFLLDQKSQTEESSFEVFFIDTSSANEKEYNYGFSVNQEGISEEWLSYTTKSARGEYKRIFHRQANSLDMPGISTRHQENIRIALQKETLLLTLGAKLNNTKLKSVRDWFLKNEIVDFGTPEENYFMSNQLPDGFVESEAVRNDVVEYFSSFDPSIIGFNVEEIESSESGIAKYRIDAKHKMNDSDGFATIPLKLESAGTLKMFALYPMLKEVLSSGGVLFVDELNARLHPLLVRTFIVEFLNPKTNPNHAQLLFTLHDSWQLDSDILRRDEIWLVEKADDGASSLFSLADFVDEYGSKVRKDENFAKNYLLGKYGAIPNVRLFDVNKGE